MALTLSHPARQSSPHPTPRRPRDLAGTCLKPPVGCVLGKGTRPPAGLGSNGVGVAHGPCPAAAAQAAALASFRKSWRLRPALRTLALMPAHPAVFLDRDGTLIEERHYLHRPEEVRLLPGAATALQRLRQAGFLLFLVTNQSGVGRGYFTLHDVARVHEHLTRLLAPYDVRFSDIYIAPEAPDQPSPGRKPSPHFLLLASQQYQIDLGQSYMIGDKLADLECGWNAGVRASILVLTGYGMETARALPSPPRGGLAVVQDLAAAADWILKDRAQRTRQQASSHSVR